MERQWKQRTTESRKAEEEMERKEFLDPKAGGEPISLGPGPRA